MIMQESDIFDMLARIEADERLHYKPANLQTNAPLALIQLMLETKSDVLRTVLGVPLCRHNKETGRWEEVK